MGLSYVAVLGFEFLPRWRRGIFWLAIAANVLAFLFFRLQQETTQFFPLGFSFYSFAGITYLTSVYSKSFKARLLDYGAAIAFFPTLTSGPICDIPTLEKEIAEPAIVDWPRARAAAVRIASGFFKKGISELIAGALMPAFSWAPRETSGEAWLVVLAFAAKFYADFSGYSDIAIGVANLHGVDVPENFNLPFIARSIGDFWRRWHISLNVWVNHYVFRPLIYSDSFAFCRAIPGIGNTLFDHRHFLAVIAAMLVTGIWHGLTWCFALWGLYMGILLCFEMALGARTARWPDLIRRLLTFFLVINGFAIFMSKNIGDLVLRFKAMYALSPAKETDHLWRFVLITSLVLLVPHISDFVLQKYEYGQRSRVFAFVSCGLFLTLHFFLDGFRGAPFEYFRF